MILRSLALTFVVGASAFAQSAPSPSTQTPAPPPAQTSDLPDAPGANTRPALPPTGPTAVIDTSMGRLTCKLYEQQAPVTVANFIGLAEGTRDWTDPTTLKKIHGQPFYNGTTFHRVIPEFMIQGGDRAGDGTGDHGYFFKDEIDPTLTFDQPGRLAMANAGAGTNGSQFFITEVPVPQLNGRHTIFGQCDTHTVLLVASIARVARNASDKPLTPVTINKITVVREGQPMPPEPVLPTAVAPAAPADSTAKPQ